MSAIEQHLASVMSEYADEAPDDHGLLSRVQAGSRRRTRHRRVGAALAAAALVTGIAVVATSLPAGKDTSSRYADPTGFLVDGRDLANTLPFTPSYLPAGQDRSPAWTSIEEYGSTVRARWIRGSRPTQVFITVGPEPLAPGGDGPLPTSMDCSGERRCALSWQRQPGQYVQIELGGLLSAKDQAAETLAVARGLVEPDLVFRPQIVLGLVPHEGCRLSDTPTTVTSLQPTGTGDGSACPVSVRLVTETSRDGENYTTRDEGQRARVGGYDGWLQEFDLPAGGAPSGGVRQYWRVSLDLDNGRHLLLQVPRVNGWTREGLDRFVRAIEVPGGAPAE